jgi:hypothetical protein
MRLAPGGGFAVASESVICCKGSAEPHLFEDESTYH